MAPTDSATQQHKIDPESLAALPRTSGVYIFRGDGTLPLYIGKSVDIRARVMSHLRATLVARKWRIGGSCVRRGGGSV